MENSKLFPCQLAFKSTGENNPEWTEVSFSCKVSDVLLTIHKDSSESVDEIYLLHPGIQAACSEHCKFFKQYHESEN